MIDKDISRKGNGKRKEIVLTLEWLKWEKDCALKGTVESVNDKIDIKTAVIYYCINIILKAYREILLAQEKKNIVCHYF